ncbi:unnamed protein product [Bemisia tabaci]|uniref:USP6 N-terminal-like protein n=1 Tax=Bemisia tabaci TaxID=7038 RepID=A0A9P0F354_BEMTA|nr:PREDICTED: USP6 N-terminal-like protein [Bemisia tabaci]CAH0389986.1 unnamed protein product [Bemisia tabaci]
MSEEELLSRAAEERAEIVKKYSEGRREGAQIDPWEDPALQIYHVLDRYGFIHEKGDFDDQKPNEIRLENEREKKWVKMLDKWDKHKDTEKLKNRVFKGIPAKLRGKAWLKLMDVESEAKTKEGKYQEMKKVALEHSADIRQIDLDVNRTYRDHIMFRKRYDIKQQELFNILAAYSIYNTDIGYCQGMSQIAALLLMYLTEEQAFWALSILVAGSKYSMHGFFIPGFPKLLRYQEHHDKIMDKFLPKLKNHLDRNGVDTGIYTLKWFFQCFLDRVPFRLALRLWDIYLLDGERILTAMAYNILKLHGKHLLKLGMDDILHFLQIKLEKDFHYSDEVTIENLKKCMKELKQSKLDFAGQPPKHELPPKNLGEFKPTPTFTQMVSRQEREKASETISNDKSVNRRYSNAAEPSPYNHRHSLPSDQTSAKSADSRPRSKLSYGTSADDGYSIIEDGSRRSLADTSITSTADLSVFSSATRSHAPDSHSLDAGDVNSDDNIPSIDPSTPRVSPSHDIVRIYVPYVSPTHISPVNGDLIESSETNKIRIKIVEEMDHYDDFETPVIENAPSPFQIDTIDDLK